MSAQRPTPVPKFPAADTGTAVRFLIAFFWPGRIDATR